MLIHETHIFHLRIYEMKPTLQDVDILLGLPVDGCAFTTMDIQNKVIICESAFKGVLPSKMFNGNILCIRWFWINFFKLLDDYDDKILQWYVNAYK